MTVRTLAVEIAASAAALLAFVCFAAGTSAVRAEGPVVPHIAERTAPEPVVPLASHRAIYNVTLYKSTGAKSPTAASGRVSYEFTGSACDGYSQVFRQVTEVQPGEGAARVSDMRSATFEDGEGQSFSFDVKTTVDANPPEVVDGHADKKKTDLLAIQLSKPTSQSVDVGHDVVFPTAHLRRIIAAAKAGQRILAVKVFDGSDNGKKVYDTTSIIGRPIVDVPDKGAPRNPAMDRMRRWPVSISYFEVGKRDEEPAYTLGFELYENGVSRALRFDYGEFILAGEMTNLELLPSKPCGSH